MNETDKNVLHLKEKIVARKVEYRCSLSVSDGAASTAAADDDDQCLKICCKCVYCS